MANEPKPGSGNRRQFVRTKVPPAERAVSVVIVLLLAVIGVAIAFKGKHFDPNLFSVRPDSLTATAAAVEGKAGTAVAMPEAKPAIETPAPEPAASAEAGPAEGGMDHGSEAPKPAPKGEPMERVPPLFKVKLPTPHTG